jgi:hypothetical protein
MKTLPNFLLLSLICATMTAQTKSAPIAEQSVFNLGTDAAVVWHSVVLTNEELDVLAKDSLMRQELNQDPPIARLTGEGLEAAVVHLGVPQERDLVVVGSGRPFIGANVGPFWVIRDLPTGPQVVLSVVTLALTVQNTRFHELRNIEAFAATAAEGSITSFRFEGRKYMMYKQSTKQLTRLTRPLKPSA